MAVLIGGLDLGQAYQPFFFAAPSTIWAHETSQAWMTGDRGQGIGVHAGGEACIMALFDSALRGISSVCTSDYDACHA